jgi:hypothetical protein
MQDSNTIPLEDVNSNADETETLVIPVDPEPVTLGLILLVILIVTVVVIYIAINTIFNGTGLNFIALLISIVLGAFVMQVAERFLKRMWKPTRFVEVNSRVIRSINKGKVERELDARMQVNVLMWHFEIRKRSRAPRGWHVVALALEQDDTYLSVYTLVSPDDFKVLNQAGRFDRLQRPTLSGAGERDMRAAGQQRRLQMAEAARGIDGAEMKLDDFKTYIARLQTLFPRWMPNTSP